MNREEFYAEVPPINRECIPLVVPEIYRTKMAAEPENIPISMAAVLLLKGMGDFGMRVQMMRCFSVASVALEASLKAYPGWVDMDLDEQVAFAGDAIREKLWEYLSEPCADATGGP